MSYIHDPVNLIRFSVINFSPCFCYIIIVLMCRINFTSNIRSKAMVLCKVLQEQPLLKSRWIAVLSSAFHVIKSRVRHDCSAGNVPKFLKHMRTAASVLSKNENQLQTFAVLCLFSSRSNINLFCNRLY